MSLSIKAILAIFLLCILVSVANRLLENTMPTRTETSQSFVKDTLPLLLEEIKTLRKTANGLFSWTTTPIAAAEPEKKHLNLKKPDDEIDGYHIQYKRLKRHLYYSYDGKKWMKYY